MKEVLSFDDVMLVPRHSKVPSRSEVDISVELRTNSDRRIKLKIPIVSSPMDTVSESEMIFRLWMEGAIGIFHRYCSIERQKQMIDEAYQKHADFFQNCRDENLIADLSYERPDLLFGGAIGVTGDYIERAHMLLENNAKLICIDVAHGHHINVKNALEALWKNCRLDRTHIMAGNIGPSSGFEYLAETGLVNSIRCGLSGGSICSTYMATGFGYPTLQSVLEANKCRAEHVDALQCNGGDKNSLSIMKTQICADGGIRGPKDINIAIAAGADFVMLGSMLAGTKATPGEKISQDGREWKQYRGGASYESQKARGVKNPRVEGVSALVPYKGKTENVINAIKDGLQSGISYNGKLTLKEFQSSVEIVKLTNASYIQGTPHILRGK